jgi:DDE superfamily endonuclease
VSVANEAVSLPVAYRLYLPESWAQDRRRRRAVGIPDDLEFQPKWQLGAATARSHSWAARCSAVTGGRLGIAGVSPFGRPGCPRGQPDPTIGGPRRCFSIFVSVIMSRLRAVRPLSARKPPEPAPGGGLDPRRRF